MPEKISQASVGGLVLQPNPYGSLPDGTLKEANNCLHRRVGILTPLHGNTAYFTQPLDGTFAVKSWNTAFIGGGGGNRSVTSLVQKPAGTATTLRIIDDQTGLYTSYSSMLMGTNSRNFAFDPGEAQHAVLRNRLIFTENSGPIVFDGDSSSFPTAGTDARPAGLPPPIWLRPTSLAPVAGVAPAIIPLNNWVSYRCHFKRVFPQGNYILTGAVSSTAVVQSGPAAVNAIQLTLFLEPLLEPVRAGDQVVFYRTLSQTTIAGLGADYREAGFYTITATDLVNGFAQFYDKTTETALSSNAPLYTNEFQDGATKTNFMPPSSRDVRAFKGAMFYVARNSWASLSLRVSGGFGVAPDALGIGVRAFTGDTVIGTNTINVTAASPGIVVGQLVDSAGGPYFPAETYITNIAGVGPWTYTVSKNALLTNVGSALQATDVLAIKQGTNPTVRVAVASASGRGLETLATLVARKAGGPFGLRLLTEGLYDPGVTLLPDGVGFELLEAIPGAVPPGSFSVQATNGANYYPPIPEWNSSSFLPAIQDNRTNRVYYSKPQEPEAVPPLNYRDVGAGAILKLWDTQSALYACCTDGIFRITGDGDDWDVLPFNPTTFLLHPDAIDSMDNMIFAWTCDGVSKITDESVDSITEQTIADEIRNQWEAFRVLGLPHLWGPQIACDDYRKEVWVNFCDPAHDSFKKTYIWNNDTKQWTTQTATHINTLAFSASLLKLQYCTNTVVYVPSTTTFQAVRVVFNPLSLGGDLGHLKQWIDVNLSLEPTASAQAMYLVPIFNGVLGNQRTITATSGQKLHLWVPRHAVLNNQLLLGFETRPFDPGITTDLDWTFNLYGLAVRYRVASDTLKR